MSASAMLSSADLQAKLQLDEIATSFGQRQPESGKDLIETIKVPLGNNLRRLGNVLPKPCYPDVRPNSPSSWTVAEQEKQQKYVIPPVNNYMPRPIDTSRDVIRSGDSSTSSTVNSAASYQPKIIPRMPLASIPETQNNNNQNNYQNNYQSNQNSQNSNQSNQQLANNYIPQPSRALYSNATNASQASQASQQSQQSQASQMSNIPQKVSYSVQARPPQIRRFPAPHQPSAPIMSQVRIRRNYLL